MTAFPYIRPISPYDQPILYGGFRPNHMIDATNRKRMSIPLTLFEHNNQVGTNIFKWDTSTVGTGSITDGTGATMGATTLSTGGLLANASAIRATRFYIHQASGKDIWAGQSFSFGPGIAGVVKRVGYFDALNGCYMQQLGNVISLGVRNNGTDTLFNQGQWSEDNLDGNGPSGVVFNPSAADIDLRIEMFGGIMIRFYLYYNNNFVLIHVVQNSNNPNPVSSQTANLTLRAEITNTTAALSIGTLKITGSNVFAEGAQEQIPAFIGAKGNGANLITVTTRRPVFSLQATPTAINNVDRNYGQIIPQNLSIYTDGNIYVEGVYNSTLTGASFASVGPTSIAGFDVAATALTGGVTALNAYVVATGQGANTIGSLIAGGQNVFEQFPLVYSSLKNNFDTITIVATSISGSAVHVGAALNWTEIY